MNQLFFISLILFSFNLKCLAQNEENLDYFSKEDENSSSSTDSTTNNSSGVSSTDSPEMETDSANETQTSPTKPTIASTAATTLTTTVKTTTTTVLPLTSTQTSIHLPEMETNTTDSLTEPTIVSTAATTLTTTLSTTVETTTERMPEMPKPPDYKFKVKKYSKDNYWEGSIFLIIGVIVIVLSASFHYYMDNREKIKKMGISSRYKTDKKYKTQSPAVEPPKINNKYKIK